LGPGSKVATIRTTVLNVDVDSSSFLDFLHLSHFLLHLSNFLDVDLDSLISIISASNLGLLGLGLLGLECLDGLLVWGISLGSSGLGLLGLGSISLGSSGLGLLGLGGIGLGSISLGSSGLGLLGLGGISLGCSGLGLLGLGSLGAVSALGLVHGDELFSDLSQNASSFASLDQTQISNTGSNRFNLATLGFIESSQSSEAFLLGSQSLFFGAHLLFNDLLFVFLLLIFVLLGNSTLAVEQVVSSSNSSGVGSSLDGRAAVESAVSGSSAPTISSLHGAAGGEDFKESMIEDDGGSSSLDGVLVTILLNSELSQFRNRGDLLAIPENFVLEQLESVASNLDGNTLDNGPSRVSVSFVVGLDLD
jgi:hypothetical protein